MMLLCIFFVLRLVARLYNITVDINIYYTYIVFYNIGGNFIKFAIYC